MAQPTPTARTIPVRTGPAAQTAPPSLGISTAPAAGILRGIRRTRHADAARKIWSAPAAQVCSTASQRTDDQYFGGSKLFLVPGRTKSEAGCHSSCGIVFGGRSCGGD